ncbi:ATP-dependent Clp protease ATP-binding subunit ClpC [Thermocatellispora tengchongensis]|uniref:ATP-dependent Clp protease ATP-binding subunit ClpC n=1 Tax=Thermocatellispora tengchongensis TaxID=1073253 RepID=A0A840NZ43_9ACTN|nr:ATP-dependent Clp protease ATP-binding subunit [Thermocatellispora tengchongensis]MBB5131466.1 ATP-dependent Clp protease ATP-binding subunit ClpC [Thermocatellispora tengchongensis]
MPKINVYLPDELAEAVKEAGVPVSAVCQRALEQAVRRLTAIRETVVGDLDLDDPSGRLAHFTARTRQVLKLALSEAEAAGAPAIGTEFLLGGMLREGTNLALHVLRALEIEPAQVERALAAQLASGSAAEAPAGEGGRRLSGPAAAALELAVTEATSLGHNYIGCEHLLLGLIAEPDGTAGQVLRGLGADLRLTRRGVTAALAGYVHLRAQTAVAQSAAAQSAVAQSEAAPQPAAGLSLAAVTEAVRRELRPLVARIERLEAGAGLSPDAG